MTILLWTKYSEMHASVNSQTLLKLENFLDNFLKNGCIFFIAGKIFWFKVYCKEN